MYTDKQYWNQYWNLESRKDINFYFSDLIDQYITWNNLRNYMEIGGAPGNIMAYMYKKHGLKVSTVDFTEKKRIEDYLKSQQVENYSIYCEDFQAFNIHPHHEKYDLVASWGFIEHFSRQTAAKFLKKQKMMVANNGYLIVELPNIRKVMWLIYKIFNRKLLQIHNLKIMDLSWLKEQITADAEFELLYASFYFSINIQNEWFVKHQKLRKVCEQIASFFRTRNISPTIKRWFYPYIVIIARKTQRKVN